MINPGMFPSRWELVQLSDVVTFLDHKRVPVKEADRVPGPYPYYGANGQQGTINGYIFDEPLVLLAEDGGYFDDPSRTIAYSISGKSWVNNHAHVLRPSKRIDLRFLTRLLENYDVLPFISGSTRAKLTKGAAQRLPIPLPPLDEQKRIAAVLDAADALRAKRRAALAKLDTLLQSVFLEMFGDPVTNPMGWEERALDDVCERIVDCPHSTPKWAEDGIICIRTSNLAKGGWNWEDTRYVTQDDYYERTKRSEILPKDIIISREGTVGIAAIVEPNMRICMGQRLVQLRPDSDWVTSEYLLYFLLYELQPERIERVMAGSTSKHLNVRDLRKLPVAVPDIATQERFVEVVKSIKSLALVNDTSDGRLNELFLSLQQQAFDRSMTQV